MADAWLQHSQLNRYASWRRTYIIVRIDRSVTYNNHTAVVVVLYFVPVSFFLHLFPLYTGHRISSSAQNDSVIIRLPGTKMTTCLLTVSCNNIMLTIIPALYKGSVDHVIS